MKILGIIGQPSCGKSTEMRRRLREKTAEPRYLDRPFRHMIYPDGVLVVGHYTLSGDPDDYEGSDKLPRNAGAKFRAMLESPPEGIDEIWWEGERLMNEPCLEAMKGAGELTLLEIDLPADRQKSQRGQKPTKSESWLKGMATRVRNTASRYGAAKIVPAESTPTRARQAPDNHTAATLEPCGKLRQHPRSPYQHPESQIELLARVIEIAGFRGHVVVTTRDRSTIVTGHLLWLACRKRGWDCPVEYQEFDSEDQEAAHVLADWRVAQYSRTDFELVRGILDDLKGREAEAAGFREEQLRALFDLSQPADLEDYDQDREPADEHDSIQIIQLMFDRSQMDIYQTRIRSLMAATGKETASEALLAGIEQEERA